MFIQIFCTKSTKCCANRDAETHQTLHQSSISFQLKYFQSLVKVDCVEVSQAVSRIYRVETYICENLFDEFLIFNFSNLQKLSFTSHTISNQIQINNRISMEQKTMKALLLEGASMLSVKDLPIPKPLDGQVLIKVMAAPINPSDIYFIKLGAYSEQKKAPCVAGFEGSGVVVENGGGLMGWGLVGKKVAFTPLMTSGSYAQYALAKSSECFPVDDEMSFQHASMSFVNPLTAMAMLDIAKAKPTKAVIVNAAASSLGRMLNRLLPAEGIEIINIVRRQQQVDLLKKEGAVHIIDSSLPDFEEKLGELAIKLDAKVCYDAIGGAATAQILKKMPKKSTIHVYGLLSGESLRDIDVGDLLYSHKTITGLFLPNWLEQKGTIKLLPSFFKLRKLLLRQLKSEIACECALEQFEKSLQSYMSNMTNGKVIVKPFAQPTIKEKIQGQKQAN